MSERCSRGHAIRSYSDVDTYCNKCQIEMPAEIEQLREIAIAAIEALYSEELTTESEFGIGKPGENFHETSEELRRQLAELDRANAGEPTGGN